MSANVAASFPTATATRYITAEEVSRHNTKEDAWIILGKEGAKKVYALSEEFIVNEHPGGEVVLKFVYGTDAQEDFEEIGHTKEAERDLVKYYIGELATKPLSCNSNSMRTPIPEPAVVPSSSVGKSYTRAEVARHNTKEDCWIILHDKVYDVTAYLPDHPGGDLIVLDDAGGDATDEFEETGHSKTALNMLPKYYIGDLIKDNSSVNSSSAPPAVAAATTSTTSSSSSSSSSTDDEIATLPFYTMSQVAQHNRASDCWIVLGTDSADGPFVYDVTEYIEEDEHPGTSEVIIKVAGQDASLEFDSIGHSNAAIRQLKDFRIGRLQQ